MMFATTVFACCWESHRAKQPLPGPRGLPGIEAPEAPVLWCDWLASTTSVPGQRETRDPEVVVSSRASCHPWPCLLWFGAEAWERWVRV